MKVFLLGLLALFGCQVYGFDELPTRRHLRLVTSTTSAGRHRTVKRLPENHDSVSLSLIHSAPPILKRKPLKVLPGQSLRTNLSGKDSTVSFGKAIRPVLPNSHISSADPIRFVMQASEDSVQLGEEFTITITAELLPILPSQLFFFESQKEFKIKLLMPQGFVQTGGDYYDYIGDSFTRGKTTATYIIRGYYSKPVDEPFVLLRGSKELSPTDLFEKKSSLQVSLKASAPSLKSRIDTNPQPPIRKPQSTVVQAIPPPNAPILTAASTTVCPQGLTALQVDGCSVGVMKFTDQNGYQWCVSANSPTSSSRSSALISVGGIQAGTYRVKCIPAASTGGHPPGTIIPCPTGLSESDWSNAVTITEVCDGACAINNVPTISGTTNLPAGTTQSTLTASGCAVDQTVRWYRRDDNNRFYPDGASFTFTNLTNGFQVYAKCIKANCAGPQSAIQTFTVPPTNPCVGNTPNAPAVANVTICSGATATLTAQGCSAGSTVNWYAADGNFFGSGNPYSFANLISNLTVYASCKVNTCESAKTAAVINVTPTPAAPVTHQDGSSFTDFEFCANNVHGLGLRADGCAGTVTWYRQGDGSPLGTGVTHVTPGGYPVSVNYYATFTNSCGTSGPSNLLRVVVHPLPSATPLVKINTDDFAASPAYSLLAGGGMAFGMDRDPNANPGYSLGWSGPNGTQGPLNDNWILTNVQSAQAGTYTYTVTDNFGCANTSSVSISISGCTPPPVTPYSRIYDQPFGTPASRVVCQGGNIAFGMDRALNSGFDVQWFAPNGSPGPLNDNWDLVNLSPSQSGTYTYRVTDKATGCTNSATVTLTVHPLPTATPLVKINTDDFKGEPAYSLLAGGGIAFGMDRALNSGFDVRWSGPNNTQGPLNDNWILTNVQSAQAGTYTYSVTDKATGCSYSSSVTITVTTTTTTSFSCTCQDCDQDAVRLTENPAVGAGNRGSSDQNYVSESVYLDPSGSNVAQTITYSDGLGRPIQKVSVATGGKTAGAPVADIVVPMLYDEFGRESVKYLPYADATNSGAFRPSALGSIGNYYAGLPDKSGNAYTNMTFEASPLNRVLTQTAPGSNMPMTMIYRTNTANELKLLTYDASTHTISVSTYNAGQLYVTEATDENGNKTVEYKDQEGRVVGKDAAGGTGPTLRTLYAYDDFGWLRCVVPPKASGNISGSVDPFAGDLLFAYDYDARGRMIRKKVPGAGVTTLTYDTRDRLKTSTDANGTTITTDYDELDRVIATKNGGTMLTQTFYDSYGGEAKGFDASHAYGVGAKTDNLKGMATSTSVLVLGTSTYLTSSTYYDELGRAIQTVSDNHKGGVDRSSSKLDYVGRVTESKLSTLNNVVIENRTAYDAGSRVKSVCQRVTDGATAANGSAGQYWEPVARHSYNGIGELSQKTLGCGIQTIDYTYQMRGWLKNINDPANLDKSATDKRFFGMKLDYDGVGNITTWNYSNAQRSGDAGSPFAIQVAQPYTYSFAYDNQNRIKTGNLTQQGQAVFGLSGVNYDENGNLTSLQRQFQGALVDNLSYSYSASSNRLSSVADGGNNPPSPNAFFKDGTANYSYDANGNLISDSGKGISSIDYNYLNLPQTIHKSGGDVSYTYSASGQKLNADFGNGKTYDYVAGLVYAGNQLEFIPTAEGRVLPPGLASTTITAGSSTTAANSYYRYEYHLKDHLGNLRAACRCGEKAGETGPGDAYAPMVVQEQHYDPYGLDLTGLSSQPGATANRFKYNGKEEQGDLGWVSYGVRMYNPAIGRWNGVDILNEFDFTQSGYTYVGNNPISRIDRYGMKEEEPKEEPIVIPASNLAEVTVKAKRLTAAQNNPLNFSTSDNLELAHYRNLRKYGQTSPYRQHFQAGGNAAVAIVGAPLAAISAAEVAGTGLISKYVMSGFSSKLWASKLALSLTSQYVNAIGNGQNFGIDDIDFIDVAADQVLQPFAGALTSGTFNVSIKESKINSVQEIAVSTATGFASNRTEGVLDKMVESLNLGGLTTNAANYMIQVYQKAVTSVLTTKVINEVTPKQTGR